MARSKRLRLNDHSVPYRPTTFGIGLERRAGALGVGLRLHYTGAGMALEGSDALVAFKGVFDVFGFNPEIVYRIASVGGGNSLLLRGGPLVEVWKIIDEPTKTRIGAQTALSMTVPLGSGFAASVLAGVALSSSLSPAARSGRTSSRGRCGGAVSPARMEYQL